MLQGTPYVYQGEEIGMTNVPFDDIGDFRDIETLNIYREMVEEGGAPKHVLAILRAKSRDNARTPMQWDASAQAGFTTGTPWIKVNPSYPGINVAQAVADPDSIFHYYRELIRLRKANPVVVYGVYDLLLPDDEEIYAFTRTLGDDRPLVILNFSRNTPVFEMPAGLRHVSDELLISNYPVDIDKRIDRIQLRPYEARVYQLWTW